MKHFWTYAGESGTTLNLENSIFWNTRYFEIKLGHTGFREYDLFIF